MGKEKTRRRTVVRKVLLTFAAVVTVVATVSRADAPATQPSPASEDVVKTAARVAFDRFKALEGCWVGKSTKGWEEKSTYTTIAGGSAVMHTSFEAHPGQTMLTVFYLDDGQLMLTHYCVAKNAPRMRAAHISPDGRQITFEFVDGANLPTRDKGHMDKAVYKFPAADDGKFTTQWTWYQQGQERWMEEIHCERVQ
jgi:hypothetical protein